MSFENPSMPRTATAREVRALTGIRGIAALLVVFYHFGMTQLDHVHDVWTVPHGYLAVDLFFILSGYVMALSYGHVFAARPVANYLAFLVKRLARVYPAYAAIGVLFFLRLAFHLHGDETLARFHLRDVVGNIFMLTGWGFSIYPLNGVAWAASAELGSYLLLPLLVWVALKRGLVSWLVTVLVAMAAIYAVAYHGMGYSGPLDVVQVTTHWPMIRADAGFTFGIAIYRYADRIDSLSAPLQDFLLATVLAAIVVSAWFFTNDFVNYALLLPLVALLSRDGPLATVLFGNRAVFHLGLISYSVYLIHPLFMGPAALLSRHVGATLPAYAICTALAFVLIGLSAWLFYVFVEVPARKHIVRALVPRLLGRPAAVSAPLDTATVRSACLDLFPAPK